MRYTVYIIQSCPYVVYTYLRITYFFEKFLTTSDERSEESARQDERQPASRSPRSVARLVIPGLDMMSFRFAYAVKRLITSSINIFTTPFFKGECI